jgi:hypothetical protein
MPSVTMQSARHNPYAPIRIACYQCDGPGDGNCAGH